MKLKRVALAIAAMVFVPSVSEAQYKVCGLGADSGLCMGYQVVSTTGNPFVVRVWDASVGGTNGRIVSFGFWNLGAAVALDEVKYFDGVLSAAYPSDANWTNGPNSGYGISGWSASAGLDNNVGDGFTLDPKPANTSCNVAGSQGGVGPDCWLTSQTRYLQFSFTGTSTFANVANIGAGFRAQNVGTNGDGSFKCGLGGGNDVEGKCGPSTSISTVPEPSTYALMAAGLAALGMVARRRRNNA